MCLSGKFSNSFHELTFKIWCSYSSYFICTEVPFSHNQAYYTGITLYRHNIHISVDNNSHWGLWVLCRKMRKSIKLKKNILFNYYTKISVKYFIRVLTVKLQVHLTPCSPTRHRQFVDPTLFLDPLLLLDHMLSLVSLLSPDPTPWSGAT